MPAQPGSRGDYSHIPIPSYEEAVSSRPSSSQNFLGPSEISHDAEREGLLGRQTDDGGPSASSSPFRGYRAPTVESARSSFDDVDNLEVGSDDGRGSARESMEELRREMSEMEFEDTPRNKWSFSTRLSSGLSSLNLSIPRIAVPSRIRAYMPSFPSWSSFRAALPSTEFLKHIQWDVSIIIRLMAFIFVISTGYLVFFSDVFQVRHRHQAHSYDPESVRHYILDHINEGRIRSDLYYITSYDHLAGTEGSYVLGKWIEKEWQAMKLGPVRMDRYEAYLNYPTNSGRKVAITEPADKQWTAKLEEAEFYDQNRAQTPVFHGHSRNGNATGHLIYANYGSEADFEFLQKSAVKIEGSIALVRYGGSQPSLAEKVRVAEHYGAVGIIMYSDPKDQDENLPEFNGQWRADGAVQRGTVSNSALVIGDILSPGFAATPEEENRNNVQEAIDAGFLPKIPSMPLAWSEDVEHLLRSIEGSGQALDKDHQDFVGSVPKVHWWTGDENSPKVTIENNNDQALRQSVYNVLTTFEGAEQALSKVVVGNHRDAWCFGAVDPGSGTAIQMEVARIFSELQRAGWRPARTIEFASWDGGDFNMIGSTEHVEGHLQEVRDNVFAYVNIDAGVFGPNFQARASPIMQRALFRVLDRLGDDRMNGSSLRKLWGEHGNQLEGLGGDGDYSGFQEIGGVPSIDLGFTGSSYPKHTCFDSFELVDQVFDHEFYYHRLMAQVLALLVLELADAPALPFDFEAYADGIENWRQDLHKIVDSHAAQPDLSPLSAAIQLLKDSAKQHREFSDMWDANVLNSGGYEPPPMKAERMQHNARSMQFEKNLLDLAADGGLEGRQQFKHVLFAPDKSNAEKVIYFPALREAIEKGDVGQAQAEVTKVAGIIEDASRNLVKQLN